jgi:hypothetical protein
VKHSRTLLAAGVSVVMGVCRARQAHAEPQISTSLTLGGGVLDLRADSPRKPRAAFHLGAWADLMFGRSSIRDMGFGPYLQVDTAAFDTMNLGGGVSWLLPFGNLGLVTSAGMVAHLERGDVQPAAAGTLFFGSKSYNYHSTYALTGGLFIQGRYGLGGPAGAREASVVGGLQVDFVVLALPFVYAYQALRGRPPVFR